MGFDTTFSVRRGYIDKQSNSGTTEYTHLPVYVTQVRDLPQPLGDAGSVDDQFKVMVMQGGLSVQLKRGDVFFDEGPNWSGVSYYRLVGLPTYHDDGHIDVYCVAKGV